jgi:hypothetical protein
MTALVPFLERAKGPGLQAVMAMETLRTARPQALVIRDDHCDSVRLVRSAETCASVIGSHGDIEPKLP